jgi:hypothetical protein
MTSRRSLCFAALAMSGFLSIGFVAQATVYVTAYDPVTGSIALVYSSSGGSFWQHRIKGKGLIGEQASGLCSEATPEVFLEQGLTASQIATSLYEQCHSVGYESYRLSIITPGGEMASVIAAGGCHSGNHECGQLKDENFMIVGGGLEPGVLEAARDEYLAAPPDTSFACRLYQTMAAIYISGGEKKDFRGASIAIDNPAEAELRYWSASGSEAGLLSGVRAEMAADGFDCPAEEIQAH